MTENEIIEILQTEKACVTRAMKNECNRDCYNCDLCEEGKDILAVYDAVIKALEEREQYRAIGTIEDFKALKEKNEPKKPLFIKRSYIQFYACPHCSTNEHYKKVFSKMRHCENCGGAFDWQ